MNRRRTIKLGMAGLATLSMVAALTLPAAADGAKPAAMSKDGGNHPGQLEVTNVKSINSQAFEIRFNAPLSNTIRNFVDGNGEYLTEYVTVSGGSDGSADAGLDGGALDEIPDTEVYTVDGDERTLRVVLGPSVSMEREKYQVRLDGDGHQLSADLLITGTGGETLTGQQTDARQMRGTPVRPEKATIERARATDARSVRLVFADSIYAGMPASRYTGTGIQVVRADGTSLHPAYVQQVPGTDSTTWDLMFDENLRRGRHELSVDGEDHRLVTSAGRLDEADMVTADFRGTTRTRRPARITDVEASGDRIVVTFDRKLDTFNAASESIELAETPGGIGGGTLSRTELLSAVNLSGNVRSSDTAATQSLAPNLERVAAFSPDLTTLVIKLEQGTQLTPGSRGSITFRAGSVEDTAGVPIRQSMRRFVATRGDAASTYDPDAEDYLKVDRDASVALRRNAFELTDPPHDLSVRRENVENRLVNERNDAVVVENKYIEATFVPGYGGRLLSLIYKPTGNDLLYTNPTGTPYGFNNNPPGEPGTSPFYHNWLMVWGGIFPTLTEAEHGKYWFLPWDYSIEQSDEAVAITMTKKDTIDYADKPSRYSYGKTGLETSVTYTVSRTSPQVDMTVEIHNPGDETVEYEYWTCTTLAPGAKSNAGSPTMEIVSPVKEIRRDPAYRWMSDVEEPANPETPQDRYLVLDKLNKMVNWESSGIAYGQGLAENPQGDWWGVVNQENGEGVVRVGDNDITPGMKFWEWGYNSSFDTNIFANGSSARPYIELWAGTSNRFFEPATIEPGATTAWTETFLPTMDLANVTNANENGSAEVAFDRTANGLHVRGDVFSTRIGDDLTVRLVNTSNGETLATKSFRGSADRSADLSAAVDEDATIRLILTDRQGEVLLEAEASPN